MYLKNKQVQSINLSLVCYSQLYLMSERLCFGCLNGFSVRWQISYRILYCISAEMVEVEVRVSAKHIDGCNQIQCSKFLLKSCHFSDQEVLYVRNPKI